MNTGHRCVKTKGNWVEATPENRVFLFIQGPHEPFSNRLGRMLRKAGSQVWRVGFIAGDRAFCFHQSTYIPFRGKSDDWAQTFIDLIEEKGVTDVVRKAAIHRARSQTCITSGPTARVSRKSKRRAACNLSSPNAPMPGNPSAPIFRPAVKPTS